MESTNDNKSDVGPIALEQFISAAFTEAIDSITDEDIEKMSKEAWAETVAEMRDPTATAEAMRVGPTFRDVLEDRSRF